MSNIQPGAARYDWDDLSVIHRNTLPPRSHFFLYGTEADAIARKNAKALSLSGIWKFHLADSPLEAPLGFEQVHFDCSQWHDIQVPGAWQLQNLGGRGPSYTNIQYPFFVNPPHPPYVENECGSYITRFRIPKQLQERHQVRLRFEGVDSGFHVWVNGHPVGYSQGARNPSEFDITAFVRPAEDNTLSVRVYKYTDGSYIEDQDQWWLSGIFRDVFLLGIPSDVRFEDLSVQTLFDEHYQHATLKAEALVTGVGTINLKLLDACGQAVGAGTTTKSDTGTSMVDVTISVLEPYKWTAETPYLYTLVWSLQGQYAATRIGFRQVELKNGLIKVNGQTIMLKGANRHEHHPQFGRTVPYEFMKQDLILMKKNNLNAIRTAHQPNDPRMYDLADELGFWIINEADIECHGFELICDAALPASARALPFWERKQFTDEPARKWTSDNPEWRDAYLDRAHHLVHRDKLHPSVIIWSLGNEAFYGQNHTAMIEWIRSQDLTRLIHYEPDQNAELVDMHSTMYPNVADIIAFGKDKSKQKPLILCEFLHAMGTGPGNVREYIDTFYEYPSLQGGCIWEWSNHGLLTKMEDGTPFFGHGGDFGDVPNDGTFVLDGVLNSDHTPRSALLEYKKAWEPVQILPTLTTDTTITIINRLDFITLEHLQCTASLSDESGIRAIGEIAIPGGIQPGATAEIQLPPVTTVPGVESLLNLSFSLKHCTLWGVKGHEVALLQVPLSSLRKLTYPADIESAVLRVEASATTLSITSSESGSCWGLDLVRGCLSSWQKNGKQLIANALKPTFYRAVTDNDAWQDGRDWKDRSLHLAKIQPRSVSWHQKADSTIIVDVEQAFAAPALSWSLDLQTQYRFSRSGVVEITIKGNSRGQNLPLTLPRIGIELGLSIELQNIQWFGRAGESYKDMKFSQPIGLHSVSKVDELWTSPEYPQECSNRTDTRWLKLSSSTDQACLTAQFLDREGSGERTLFDFMASWYCAKDIEESKHPFELERKQQDYVVLRLDADHHGLGTGSCGPKTLEQYALKTKPFDFTIVLH